MSIAIEQAFISKILTGGLALDIVHDNGVYSVWNGTSYDSRQGVYEPTNGRAYITIKTFSALQKRQDMKNTDFSVGTYQAIVKYPIGDFAYRDMVQKVNGLFGDVISYGSQVVNIIDKSIDGGRIENGFYQVVIRINYKAFIAK